MTIQELIEKLKTFPPDIKVVVRGYEDGYNDISDIREVAIKLNASEYWWDGQHGDTKDVDAIRAIELAGLNNNAKDEVKFPK